MNTRTCLRCGEVCGSEPFCNSCQAALLARSRQKKRSIELVPLSLRAISAPILNKGAKREQHELVSSVSLPQETRQNALPLSIHQEWRYTSTKSQKSFPDSSRTSFLPVWHMKTLPITDENILPRRKTRNWVKHLFIFLIALSLIALLLDILLALLIFTHQSSRSTLFPAASHCMLGGIAPCARARIHTPWQLYTQTGTVLEKMLIQQKQTLQISSQTILEIHVKSNTLVHFLRY